jgi:hypothetical protein
MSRTQRIIVEKRGCGSGCGTVLAVAIVLGLLIVYWYIAVAVAALIMVAVLIQRSQVKKKERRRSGPRDPWINRVSVALAEHGLSERARNTGKVLAGIPIEGDIEVREGKTSIWINLLTSPDKAEEAKTAMLAQPKTRENISAGRVILKTADRLLYVARSRGTVVDEYRLNEVIEVVNQITPESAAPPDSQLALPQPLNPAPSVTEEKLAETNDTTEAQTSQTPQEFAAAQSDPSGASADVLEQLRKLGELRTAGVLSESEFDEQKVKLLKRI